MESLGRIGAIARRIVSQFRRDPRTLGLIFVAPILVMTLVGYVIAEKTTVISIGVVDLDQGAVFSRGPLPAVRVSLGPVLEDLLADQQLELERWTEVEVMRAEIAAGNLAGGVVIPEEFSANCLAQKAELEGISLILEGSDPILAADIGRRFAKAVQGFPAAAIRALPGGLGLKPPGQAEIEYVYGGADLGALSYFAPGYVAFFAFFFTFLLTSVSFLRERASGTMERLLASPLKRHEVVIGYLLGFGLFALVQSLIILLFAVYVLGIKLAGHLGAAFVVESALVAVAVVMGIFFSFYARNELQVIQFIPIVIIPQIILSGFLTPVETMWAPLRWLAAAMPLAYANTALRAVIIRGDGVGAVTTELAVLAGFFLFFTLLAARLLKREIV